MSNINYNKVIENDFELPLYEEMTDKVIKYLGNFGQADFWEIVRNVGGSERRMLRLINEMVNEDILIFKDNIFRLRETDNSTYYKTTLCPTCSGKRTIINDDVKKNYPTLKEIWLQKPVPTLLFDQRPVTLDTTMNRLSYIMMRGDIKNKDVVFIGDDDLTSIAFGLTDLAKSITVFDIDKRLIDFINEQAQKYNLNVQAICSDITEGIDSKYYDSFDVFITDPTPEPIPFTIFMNTGVNLLRKDSSSIMYTSIYSSAMQKSIELQEIITTMGLYITDSIPVFTEYQSLERLFSETDNDILKKFNIKLKENLSICFTETLVRMELTDKTTTKEISFKVSDLFGKATKRALNGLETELLSYTNEDLEYIKNVAKNMTENTDRTLTSK